MDKDKHAKPLTEILSPSKITDYFCSKSDLQNSNDLKHDKESSGKLSSVYHTPKSSPFKDDEENQVSQGLPHPDANSESQPPMACTKHNHICKSPIVKDQPESHTTELSETGGGTVVKCHETRTPSRLNGCIQTSDVSDTSRRKSNQHRICHITRSSRTIVNTEIDHSNSIQPTTPVVESVAASSPSLPRPKVRKNSKPKSAKADSQPPSMTQSDGAKPKPSRRKKPEPVQSTAITDYFPIRRSGRQTKSQIEKETQIHLEKLITSGCEDGLKVKEFEGKGRGIVAAKMFDKGDYVVEYAGDLLDMDTARDREAHYALTPSIGCYMYFFNHRNKQYCVDATSESGRLGRLINHSRNGNCGTKVVMLDGRPRLILVAAKYIKEGEELSYDYGDRSKAALDAHPWLKL